MDTFIKDTKHREHQLEDLDLVSKKFLCTQLPTFVDYKEIYPFISDDLGSINFRSSNILDDYANVRHAQPELLSTLLGSAVAPANVPVFDDYVSKINPPQNKEVLFFFLQGAKKKNLSEHIDYNVQDANERKRLFSAIQKYQVPPTENMKSIIETIGNFMMDLKVGTPVLGEEENDNPNIPSEEEDEEVNQPVSLPTSEPTQFSETDHWENPVLKAFKIDAGLSTRFSSENSIKQILIASCAPHMCEGPGFSSLLGKFQTNLPEINYEEHTLEHFPINYVDTMSSDIINEIVQTDEAQNLYHGLLVKPKDSRELVKTLIVRHHPTLGKFVQVSKNYKGCERLTEEVGECLIGQRS